MHVGEPAAELLAEDRRQRRRQRLDDRHLDAEPAGRRGDLLADEAGADDHQASAGDEFGPQAAGVGQGAQGVDVVVVEEGQAPRRAAGRDQQLAVGERLAGVQRQRPRRRVERLGPGAEQQLDPLLRVPVRRPEGDRVLAGRSRQHLLGERRPVVGRLRLGADDADRRLVLAAAEGLGGALRRQTATDDHNSWVFHHASSRTGVLGIVRALRSGRAGRAGRLAPASFARFLAIPESTR